MKKLILLSSIVFLAFVTNAQQNIAINTDGTAAHASSILDVKSTTKGMLMPRMTSAQRGDITAPTLGLIVFDTDTKTLWVYEGTSWKNLYTSGGALTLPFSQSVNIGTAAFQVTNQGTGAAIEGSSSAQFGIGMSAKTTGEGGWGLYAFSNGAGSQSVRSYADNGTAYYGENNNPANTNTLLNLLNKGAGKTGSFQLGNSTSTSANVQIAGNHLGEQLKIYQTNAANAAAAVSIENSGTGIGLEVIATTGYAVKAVTNTATGMAAVHGQNNGTAGSGVIGVSHAANTQGVYGNSNNGIGVRGLSSSGIALYGNSATGYALETSGKIKIAGGNTSPGDGKVLTSDASGNATWQALTSEPSIGFKAYGIVSGFAEIPYNVDTKVQFNNQVYDLGNNFIDINENGNLSEASAFYPPLNGLYHFNLSVGFDSKSIGLVSYEYQFVVASIYIVRAGVTTEVARFTNSQSDKRNEIVRGSTDLVLNAGDKVYVTARQGNFTEVSMPLDGLFFRTEFSGHLVKKI